MSPIERAMAKAATDVLDRVRERLRRFYANGGEPGSEEYAEMTAGLDRVLNNCSVMTADERAAVIDELNAEAREARAAAAAARTGPAGARTYRGDFPQVRTGERLCHLPPGSRVPPGTVGLACRVGGRVTCRTGKSPVWEHRDVAAGSVVRFRPTAIDWSRTDAYVLAVVRAASPGPD